MNRKLLHKLLLIILAILQFTAGKGQQFRYRSALETVSETGFYGIDIYPGIAARTNENLADLRIHDAAGKQVPFIIQLAQGIAQKPERIDFALLAEGSGDNKQYFFIIGNPARHTTGELELTFGNTQVNRQFSISGSDDGKDWYAIKEQVALDSRDQPNSKTFDQLVPIPLSNYAFYKISFAGKDQLPVKLVRAGISEKHQSRQSWIQLPAPEIRAKDSTDKRSYYTLLLDADYPVGQFDLHFTGAAYFQRQLTIFDKHNLQQPVQVSMIRSSAPAAIAVAGKAREWLIVVDNKDNPPLLLNRATAFMEKKTLVAYLMGGESYTLLFGDSTRVSPPSYDLNFFSDSIPAVLKQVTAGPVERNDNVKKPAEAKEPDRKWITWLAIGIVLVVLVLITARLTREVNASKDKTY